MGHIWSFRYLSQHPAAVCFSGSSWGIPILKIKLSHDCHVSIMGILIHGKTVFTLKQSPDRFRKYYIRFVGVTMDVCLSPSLFNAGQIDLLLVRVIYLPFPRVRHIQRLCRKIFVKRSFTLLNCSFVSPPGIIAQWSYSFVTYILIYELYIF